MWQELTPSTHLIINAEMACHGVRCHHFLACQHISHLTQGSLLLLTWHIQTTAFEGITPVTALTRGAGNGKQSLSSTLEIVGKIRNVWIGFSTAAITVLDRYQTSRMLLRLIQDCRLCSHQWANSRRERRKASQQLIALQLWHHGIWRHDACYQQCVCTLL